MFPPRLNSKNFASLFVAVFLLTLPLNRYYWDFWSQHVLFLGTAVLLCVLLYDVLLTGETVSLPGPIFWILGGLYIFFYGASAKASAFQELSRNQSLTLFNAVSLAWIVTHLETGPRKHLQAVFCAASALLSLFFVYSYLPWGREIMDGHSHFFLNENLVASFNLLAFFNGLDLLDASRDDSPSSPARKKFLILCLILNVSAVLCARSFGVLLGLAAAAAYAHFKMKPGTSRFHLPGRLRRASPYWAGLAALVPALALLWIFRETLLQSLADRARFWSAAWRMSLERPLLGFGPGTFEKNSASFFGEGLKSLFAHSFLLQTAAETGWVAALALFSYLVMRIKNSGRIWIACGLTAVLAQNLADFSLNVSGVFILFCLVLAWSGTEKSSRSLLPVPKSLRILLWILISLCLAAAGWRWGVRPALAFNASLNAQESFDKMDLASAEKQMRESLSWDSVPAAYNAGLARILFMRSRQAPGNRALIDEALRLQKAAVEKEPGNVLYQKQLETMALTAAPESR